MKRLLTTLTLLFVFMTHALADSGWPVQQPGTPIYGATHDETHLYITTQNGHCYAINLDTGAVDWEQTISWNVSSPAVIDGVLYMPSYNDLSALSTENGEVLWKTGDYNAYHVLALGKQLFARSRETLIQLDAENGEIENTFTDLGHISSVAHTPRGLALARSLQYLDASPEFDATLSLLDPADGKAVWRVDMLNCVLGNLATDGQRIYVATNESGMAAYNVADGAIAWQSKPRLDADVFPPSPHNGYRPGKALLWQDFAFFTILGGKEDWSKERAQLIKAGLTSLTEYNSAEAGLVTAVDQATGQVIWEQIFPRPAMTLQMAKDKLVHVTSFGWVRIINPESGVVEHTFTLPYGNNLGLDGAYKFAFVQGDALYAGIDGWVWRVAWDDLLRNDDWRGVIDYQTAELGAAKAEARFSAPMMMHRPMTETETLHAEVDFGQHINVENVVYEFYRDGEKIHELYHSPVGSIDRNIDSASISLYLSGLSYQTDYRNSETFNLLMKHKRAAQGRDDLDLYAIFQNGAKIVSLTAGQSLTYTKDQLNLEHGYAATVFEEVSWNDNRLPVMVLLTEKPDRSIPINWLRGHSKNLQEFRDTYPKGDYLLISFIGGEIE